jgi:hypothetical protein
LTDVHEDGASDRATSLLRRAAELGEAVDQLQNREATADAVQGLRDALEGFDSRLADARSLHLSARALSETGRSVELPDARPTARSLRSLAEKVDADPNAVRNRRRQLDAVSSYVAAGQQIVEPALRQIVDDARAGIEAGTVSSLRKIGLRDAADALAVELSALGQYTSQLPRTKEDLEVVDAAAARIKEILTELAEPRKARLLQFVQEASSSTPLTLADIDADLLAELQESGVAADFAIVAQR